MVRRWLVAIGLIAAVAAPADAQTKNLGLTIEFEAGAAEPLPGRKGGDLGEFVFSRAGILEALSQAGVIRLEKIFPDFRSEDRFTRNRLGEPVVLEDLSRFYSISILSKDYASAAERLRRVPGIRSATVNGFGKAMDIPNDPNFIYQWWLHDVENPTQDLACTNPPGADADINAPDAWSLATGSPNVRVAIIDTGVHRHDNPALTHEDIPDVVNGPSYGRADYAQMVPDVICDEELELSCTGPDTCAHLDTKPHGTGVAGIVGARKNNGLGVAGIASGVTLVSYDTDTPCALRMPQCWSARAIAHATAADPPIAIFNMSYGANQENGAELAAAKNAFLLGRLLVSSMGNHSGEFRAWPASYERFVCAVAATGDDGLRWPGSNFGSWIDLSAPGGDEIVTTQGRFGPYYTCQQGFGGTSAAAPVVSGVAALLLSDRPDLEGEDLQQVMSRTALDVVGGDASPGWDIYTGHGRVRADAALDLVSYPREVHHGWTGSLSPVASEQVSVEFIGVEGLPNGTYPLTTRHRMQGTVTLPQWGTALHAWVRSSGSQGAQETTIYDAPREAPWARIVTTENDHLVVETFLYEVRLAPEGPVVWVPTTPQQAAVATTAIGVTGGGGGCDPWPGPPPPPSWWCGGEIESSRGPTSPAMDPVGPMPGNGTVAWYDIAGRKLTGPGPRGVYFTRTFRDGKWGTPRVVVVK